MRVEYTKTAASILHDLDIALQLAKWDGRAVKRFVLDAAEYMTLSANYNPSVTLEGFEGGMIYRGIPIVKEDR